MEEMSFPLDLERSTEFKLAEESQHEQGRVKSRSEGSEELGSDKNQLGGQGSSMVVSTEPPTGQGGRQVGLAHGGNEMPTRVIESYCWE